MGIVVVAVAWPVFVPVVPLLAGRLLWRRAVRPASEGSERHV